MRDPQMHKSDLNLSPMYFVKEYVCWSWDDFSASVQTDRDHLGSHYSKWIQYMLVLCWHESATQIQIFIPLSIPSSGSHLVGLVLK